MPRREATKSSQGEPQDPLAADFRIFLAAVWDHLRLPKPTPIQNDIANYLQHGPKRSVIEAFRGVGKSWITSAFALWSLYKDPQINILVVSASKNRADAFSTFTLRLIREVPFLRHLHPRDDQRNSKIEFDVGPARAAHSASVKSVGITGQIAGSRADLVIADDIEVPNNSMTQHQRDKLAELVKEFDAVLKPGGRIVYLGTPQTEQSLYQVLEERGYEVRIWPARFPDQKQQASYGARLAPWVLRQIANGAPIGSSTEPSRFSDEDLLERELSYGRSGFALQFMLDPSRADADRYPLRLSDLMVFGLNPDKAPAELVWASSPELVLEDLPCVGFRGDRWHRPAWHGDEWVPYSGCVMAIDPSGRGAGETAYAVVKVAAGKQFLVASGGFRDGHTDEAMEAMAKVAKLHKVGTIIVEPNYAGNMFISLLQPHLRRANHQCTVTEADWSKTQKEARIIGTLEPVMNQHRLVVCRSVVEADWRGIDTQIGDDAHRYRLFYQMTRITPERGSLAVYDRLDALAMAVAYWEDHMAVDQAKAAEQHRQGLLEKELERFVESAIGGPKRTNRGRWV